MPSDCAQTPMSDHVARFWRLLESDAQVRIIVQTYDASLSSSAFPDDVAKAIAADRHASTLRSPAVSSEAVEAVAEAIDPYAFSEEIKHGGFAERYGILERRQNNARKAAERVLTAAAPHMTGAQEPVPDRLYNADEPMADGEVRMTAAEDVLAWLMIEVVGVPDDEPITPQRASDTIAPMLRDLRSIEDMLCGGQGDDDGMKILPDFEKGMSVPGMVEACLHLLEKRRDVIAAYTTPPAPSSADSGMLAALKEIAFAEQYDSELGRIAREAIAAAEAATPAEGWALVPVEPTPEILDAVAEECKAAWGTRSAVKAVPSRSRAEWREIAKPFYRAMLSAAPKGGR